VISFWQSALALVVTERRSRPSLTFLPAARCVCRTRGASCASAFVELKGQLLSYIAREVSSLRVFYKRLAPSEYLFSTRRRRPVLPRVSGSIEEFEPTEYALCMTLNISRRGTALKHDVMKQNAFPSWTPLLCCQSDRSLFPARDEQSLVGRAQVSNLAGY
jgi:hypothetical protein